MSTSQFDNGDDSSALFYDPTWIDDLGECFKKRIFALLFYERRQYPNKKSFLMTLAENFYAIS